MTGRPSALHPDFAWQERISLLTKGVPVKLGNLKIGVRLGLLAALFFFALLIVGLVGWRALDAGNTRASAAMVRLGAMGQASDAARSAQVEFKIQIQEWKNILVRGDDQEKLDKYRAAFIKGGDATRADLARLATMLDQLAIATPMVNDALRTQEGLTARYLKALEQFDPAQPPPPTRSMRWSRAPTANRPARSTTSSPTSASRRRTWRSRSRLTMQRRTSAPR